MNTVTTPNPGERAVSEWKHGGVSVTQLPADPICPRVSLGGLDEAAYLVFRGSPDAIKALLRRALAAMDVA